jgi:hypothetical protein
MAFLRDDDALAFAVLALCDALDHGATDSVRRIEAVNKARKHAHNVLARGKRKKSVEPDDPVEGETNGPA